MAEILEKEYTASIDSKKRLTIRGAKHSHFKVEVFSSGKVVLKPRILVDPQLIPRKTLKMIASSVKNLKAGKVSKPVNLKKYK